MENMNIQGKITEITLVDSRSGEVEFQNTMPIDNLITDKGMNIIHEHLINTNLDEIFGFATNGGLGLGSGDTPASYSDNDLDNLFGIYTRTGPNGAKKINDYQNLNNKSFTIKKQWRIDAGQATGEIREVGLYFSTADLITRTLLKDSSGTPVTLDKKQFNILYLTYEIVINFNIDDVEIITSDPETGQIYTITVAPCGVSEDPMGAGNRDSIWSLNRVDEGISDQIRVVDTDQYSVPSPGTSDWESIKIGGSAATSLESSAMSNVVDQVQLSSGSDSNGYYLLLHVESSVTQFNYNNGIQMVLIGFLGASNLQHAGQFSFVGHISPAIVKNKDFKWIFEMRIRIGRN